MDKDYVPFFDLAMGGEVNPYPYQIRLAEEPWPTIVNVPTGMGKTAAIVLSWLYKRSRKDNSTPRRLVYCLPMRVLVEQIGKSIERWIANLTKAGLFAPDESPGLSVLMGGDVNNDWDMHPEMDAILVGTQDQLLSRALNRGYGMSRFRWPVHFGLLNSDCLWVLDEVQLMGTGLLTSVQFHAFRKKLGTAFPTRSLWMSATLDRSWLNTVDFDASAKIPHEFKLEADDIRSPFLKKRFEAMKPLTEAPFVHVDTKGLAEFIKVQHRAGTRTLLIVNTVKRAIECFEAIKQKSRSIEVVLIHSRLRPPDRKRALERLIAHPGKEGTICISTQVIEAGVDVSCATLVTDLAPWASLVQRFGRCNRDGLEEDARVFWIKTDLSKKGAALPYLEEELKEAASILENLKDAGPQSLPPQTASTPTGQVLRRKDILDLFDTTPDLAGADIDISRFIRETEDHDLQVFWRDLPEQGPDENEPGPARDELCSVPVGDLRSVNDLDMWRWDHLQRAWIGVRPSDLFPGLLVMLRQKSGCYNAEKGWTGVKRDVPEVAEKGRVEEANDDDFNASGVWQTLLEHSNAVVKELEAILRESTALKESLKQSLRTAARWHDAGKTHPVFQNAMLGNSTEVDITHVWAKTAHQC